MSIKSINDRAFYMKIYSNPITIAIPIFCSVTNELTAFSHMRITMQNPALLIGQGTVPCKMIPEDKRLGQLGKQTNMDNTDDMDSQDTADGTPSTKTSNVIPPRKKKKEKAAKIQTRMGKRKCGRKKYSIISTRSTALSASALLL